MDNENKEAKKTNIIKLNPDEIYGNDNSLADEFVPDEESNGTKRKRKRKKKAPENTVYIDPKVRIKRMRAARRKNGLCTYCGKPVDRDGALCAACLAKNAEQTKARTEMYLSAGVCPICGKNDIFPHEKSCKECKAKFSMRLDKRMDQFKVYQRERYRKFESMGLCSRCGKRPPEEGKKWCRQCLDRHNKKARNRREDVRARWATDLCCMRCGKPERVEGKKLCPDCYRAALAAAKKCAENRNPDFKKAWAESNMRMRAHYRKFPRN